MTIRNLLSIGATTLLISSNALQAEPTAEFMQQEAAGLFDLLIGEGQENDRTQSFLYTDREHLETRKSLARSWIRRHGSTL